MILFYPAADIDIIYYDYNKNTIRRKQKQYIKKSTILVYKKFKFDIILFKFDVIILNGIQFTYKQSN